MSSPENPDTLNFTPQALFPHIPNANLDPKCVVIALVVEVWVTKFLAEGNEVERQQVLDDAKLRYKLLNEGKKLPFSVAVQRVSAFVGKGISFEVAKEYFGFLLNPADADEWHNFKSLE